VTVIVLVSYTNVIKPTNNKQYVTVIVLVSYTNVIKPTNNKQYVITVTYCLLFVGFITFV
jgi:hypothetical protein